MRSLCLADSCSPSPPSPSPRGSLRSDGTPPPTSPPSPPSSSPRDSLRLETWRPSSVKTARVASDASQVVLCPCSLCPHVLLSSTSSPPPRSSARQRGLTSVRSSFESRRRSPLARATVEAVPLSPSWSAKTHLKSRTRRRQRGGAPRLPVRSLFCDLPRALPTTLRPLRRVPESCTCSNPFGGLLVLPDSPTNRHSRQPRDPSDTSLVLEAHAARSVDEPRGARSR